MDRRSATLLLTLVLWPALMGALQDLIFPAARSLGWSFGQLYLSPPIPEPLDIAAPDEFVPAPQREELVEARPAPQVARKPKRRVHRGIRVSKQTILRLAQARAIPSSVPVPAKWPRPPGLKLLDVGRLGLGVQNGDVLTKVMGVASLNRGVVIGVVGRARARRAPAISAEFWRGNLRYQLHVEMPYPPEKAATAVLPRAESTASPLRRPPP